MSRHVKVNFAVKSMAIMKSALNEMGTTFVEVNEDQIEIKRPYHNIVFKINAETSCDDMDQVFVNSVKQKYNTMALKDRLIREGNQFKEDVLANGQVRITIL